MRNTFKHILSFAGIFLLASTHAWAAGPPAPSVFSNPLAVSLLALMILLLIVIGILANILVGAADYSARKRKKEKLQSAAAGILTVLFLLTGSGLMAQDASTETIATQVIGGLSASTFYIMITVLFLELTIILGLLINIKILLKKEKTGLEESVEETALVKKPGINWWSRFNKFKPVEQEADIDLGHNYDGIRELDNRLPPWWLYGFYLTIVFAVVYLWRFHVSHTGPSSVEEYERSVARAEIKIQEYLKQKGESVDENTVTLLTASDELAAGKVIYTKSCASCHADQGGGLVGPNLTDEYWLHGGDIKSVFKIIRYGYNAMPQWQNQYSNKQIAQVASYIKSLKGTNPSNPKAPEGTPYIEEAAPEKPAVDSAVTDKKMAIN